MQSNIAPEFIKSGWVYLITAKDFEYDEEINEMKCCGKNKKDAIHWFKMVCGSRFRIVKCERKERCKLNF